MIQFNKTFFQFTKRFALVVMLIGVSNAMWALSNHSDNHYSKVTVEMAPTSGAGVVYVYTGNDVPSADARKQEATDNCDNYNQSFFWGILNYKDEDADKHVYHLVAEDHQKYKWLGWHLIEKEGENEKHTFKSKDYAYSTTDAEAVVATSQDSNNPTLVEYIAKWSWPKVDGIDGSSAHIETIYNKDIYEKEIKFNISGSDELTDFESPSVLPEKSAFGIAANKTNHTTNQYITGIQYTPTGVHTAYKSLKMDSDPTANVGSLTLTSKYVGGSDAPSTQTFTLTVKEDYTPWFEMGSTECVFASVPTNTPSNAISKGTISPNTISWNYAAQQAYPTTDEGDDPTSPEDNKLVEGTIWKIKLTNNPNNIFTIDATKTEGEDEEGWYKVTKEQLTAAQQSLITFTPPLNATTDDVYTATLNVICEYYDAVGNIIPALQKDGNDWGNELVRTVTLKGEAMLNPSILLNNKEEESVVFDAVVCGSTPLKYSNGTEVTAREITYITNISAEDLQQSITGNGKDYFDIDVDREKAKISVTLKPNVNPGTHAATLTISGTYVEEDENGEETTGTKTATLTITANVILANPVLSGSAGNASATLTWSPAPGATSYEIYYKEGYSISKGEGTPIACAANEVEKIIEGLTNNHTYSFIIVAKYNNDASLDAESNVVTLRPTDFSETINWSGRLTSLYTGTQEEGDIDGSNFPYMTLRRVDVTAAFDVTEDGEQKSALFDYIVIFGETTFKGQNHSATSTAPSDASTPCYVYERQADGKTYELYKMRVENTEYNSLEMNADTKHPGFTIDATQDSDKKISIYITGFCPFASTGTTWGENAVMHITGSNETTVDIYLDNAQIFARPKLNNGTISTENTVFGEKISDLLKNGVLCMQGSGSVLSFSTTNNNFRPSIHLHGTNILQSHLGMTLSGSYTQDNNTLYGEYKQYSAPIQLMTDGSDGKTIHLTIDDVWGTNNTVRVNGSIILNTSHSDAPLFDMGKDGNAVNLRGGKITLNNTENQYIATYNKWKRTETLSGSGASIEKEKIIFGANEATDFNTGTKPTHEGGEVTTGFAFNFLDGTYYSKKNLSVPSQTTVDGGSYPGCTFVDDMFNKEGKKLTLISTNIPADIATISPDNGIAVFADGFNSFKDLMDYIYPNANWMNQENPTKHYASLSTYYDGANKSYGYSSLTPDAENKVHLLLPKDENPTIKNWSVSGPSFNVTTEDETTSQESAQTIYCTSQSEVDNFGKTYNMLYMETDGNIQEALANGGYGISYGEGENNISATITSDCDDAQISNNSEYVISDRVYIMKPLVATDWMLFCPPFDVANVYIVEAYPEKQLIEDYKGDNKVSIPAANIEAARKAQAQRFMDLYVYWYNYGEVQGGSDYFYDETNDALGKFIMDWADYETGRGKDGVATSGNAYQPVIEKLQHFMGYEESAYPEGMHWWDANYFLYESVGAWTPTTSGDYTPTWTEVKKPSKDNNAIMTAGKVYAMNFPYNVIGGHNPETTWDYWTGKYIIIESTKRPEGHTIKGGSYDMQGIKTTDDNKAWMCGNPTFKTLQITAADDNQVYSVLNNYGGTTITDTDTTIVVNSYTMTRDENGAIDIPSTRGFVLANPPAPANTRARAINYKTGEVTYEKIEDENPDGNNPGLGSGIPTIMGDLSLMVVPTAEGLTITPLKEQHVMLFDAEGKMIFSKYMSEEENVSLPTGVYVVRGEYEQVKAIKK